MLLVGYEVLDTTCFIIRFRPIACAVGRLISAKGRRSAPVASQPDRQGLSERDDHDRAEFLHARRIKENRRRFPNLL